MWSKLLQANSTASGTSTQKRGSAAEGEKWFTTKGPCWIITIQLLSRSVTSPKYSASETQASKPIKGPIFFIIAMAPVSFIKFFVWFGIASCFLCLVHWYLAVRSSTFWYIVVRNSMMKCGVARCSKHYRTHHWTFHSFCCHGVGMGSVIWKQPVLPDMQIYANETWPKCWDVSIGNFSSLHICHFSFWNFRPRLARVLLVY